MLLSSTLTLIGRDFFEGQVDLCTYISNCILQLCLFRYFYTIKFLDHLKQTGEMGRNANTERHKNLQVKLKQESLNLQSFENFY